MTYRGLQGWEGAASGRPSVRPDFSSRGSTRIRDRLGGVAPGSLVELRREACTKACRSSGRYRTRRATLTIRGPAPR